MLKISCIINTSDDRILEMAETDEELIKWITEKKILNILKYFD